MVPDQIRAHYYRLKGSKRNRKTGNGSNSLFGWSRKFWVPNSLCSLSPKRLNTDNTVCRSKSSQKTQKQDSFFGVKSVTSLSWSNCRIFSIRLCYAIGSIFCSLAPTGRVWPQLERPRRNWPTVVERRGIRVVVRASASFLIGDPVHRLDFVMYSKMGSWF